MEENELVLKFNSLLPRMALHPVDITYEDREGFVHCLKEYAYKCLHCQDLFTNPVPCRNESYYPYDHDCRRKERQAVELELTLCRVRKKYPPVEYEIPLEDFLF